MKLNKIMPVFLFLLVGLTFVTALTWGSFGSGATGQVNQTFPSDNYIAPSLNIPFACVVNITSGDRIVNASLYHNQTGTWTLNQTSRPTTYVNASGGTDALSPETDQRGVYIFTDEQINITNIGLRPDSTATVIHIQDDSGNEIVNSTVNSLNASFTQNLTAGVLYRVVVDNNGASWTDSKNSSYSFFPQDVGPLDFRIGVAGGVNSSGFHSIYRIDYEDPNPQNYSVFEFPLDVTAPLDWSCQACANDTTCGYSQSNRTVLGGISNEEYTFNATSYETATESYVLNLSHYGGLTIDNPSFNFSSSSFSASASTEDANHTILSASVTLNSTFLGSSSPLSFSYDFGDQNLNSTLQSQNVSDAYLVFCNATFATPYINFTFKNESSAEEDISASVSSSWSFWLGDGSYAKTVSLTNSTEFPSHAICSFPSDRTLNTQVNLTYNNAESQQRAYSSSPILSNSTTSQVLYLLSTGFGLYSQFQTVDTVGNPISLVNAAITRVIGSSTVSVTSGLTDSSGLVVFFLDPDATYTGTFTKSGYSSNIFSFVPVTDTRYVTMGTGTTISGSNISSGTDYEIYPLNSTLTNDTSYTFAFNVTSTSGIEFISMNITNSSGFQYAYQSNSGTGYISSVLDTGSNTTFYGKFEMRTSEENLTFTRLWRIGNIYEGEYSISKQGGLFLGYGFSDFIRFLIVLSVLFIVVVFMSGNEVSDNNESKVAVVLMLIWIFSSVGWLNNPAVTADTGLAQFAKQYGIAMLSTVAGSFFFMRRLVG